MNNSPTATRTAEPATPAARTDFDAIKARQRAAWGSGDYGTIGTTLQIVGESLCEAVDLRAGSKVLDVAAGNGNCSLAAARRWCDVTSTDYVAALLDGGRRRAEAEGLTIRFQEADAEALPFADGEFDVILSSFGVMFTPDHRKAAAELLRVCRPGGQIALASWTPNGFIGRLFATIGKYVAPPAGLTPAARWGAEEYIEELFSAGAARAETCRRQFVFRYRSPQHFVDVFRTWYGPVLKAFQALPAEGQLSLERDILMLLTEFNRSGDDTLIVASEYLEAIVTRR